MAPNATFGSAAAVLGTLVAKDDVFAPPPSTIPAGFDSVLQFSTALLHRNLAANLSRRSLNPLSVRVPYQSELVSPGLRQLVAPHIQPIDSAVGGVFLEVQVLNPTPQTLRWQTPPEAIVTTAGTASKSRIRLSRKVDLAWTIQVYLFKPRRGPGGGTLDPSAGTSGGTSPTTGLGGFGGTVGSTLGVFESATSAPPPPPEGSRVPLATGTATMNVPTELAISAALYQFGITLNFDTVQPTYGSTDPVMVEFLQSDLATSMLAQAIAPLRNQTHVGLTPTIALAGSLTTSQVSQLGLPTLHVHDMIVEDDAGQVLTMCVTLGNDSHGAFSLVRSFLAGHHFAYFASSKVFAPMLKGLWRANAIRTPVVNDVPVEMPLEEGSEETGTGKARVKVKLSETLIDAALVASVDPDLGDPLRIIAEQTVELLGLWDPHGHRIEDIGDLATPSTQPFALSLQLFDRPVSIEHTIKGPLRNLFAAMFLPLYFPMIERYQVRRASGFASSPLHAIVVRWSLPRQLDDFMGPNIGTLSING